jgi:hypothetical protein
MYILSDTGMEAQLSKKTDRWPIFRCKIDQLEVRLTK